MRITNGIILSLFIASSFSVMSQDKTRSYIPLEKNVSSEYVSSLFLKGEPHYYRGDETKYIAMPCGGIGAGEVDVQGDGTLCFYEDVFNDDRIPNAGHGYSTGYQYIHPSVDKSKIENMFMISYSDGKQQKVIPLDKTGFNNISFRGEYPIAMIDYNETRQNLPFKVSSKVYTGYVPNSVRKSANPMVIMTIDLKNMSQKKINLKLGGWMKGILMNDSVEYVNRLTKDKHFTSLTFDMSRKKNLTQGVLKSSRFGNMSLALLDATGKVAVSCSNPEDIFEKNDNKSLSSSNESPDGGGLYTDISLSPNQQKSITFVISWFFPNYYENFEKGRLPDAPGLVGRIYDNWYDSSLDVIKYCSSNITSIEKETNMFHDTYFDNSIPYWLTNRTIMSLSTLAAGNVKIWKNGRFYAYEGVGFCSGTCGHVYNFVSTVAQLFPELERSVRLLQDFNPEQGYNKSGRINFRGHKNNKSMSHWWASDAQSGYVLKAYREHLMSADNKFLESVWDKVKMAMAYQIFKDGAEIGLPANGVLECEQTFWDPMWYGPNPYNESLYLAALKASQNMAVIMKDDKLAERYKSLFDMGLNYMNNVMWNGNYYIHIYPMGMTGHLGTYNGLKTPEETDILATKWANSFNRCDSTFYRSNECDANQLFGQNWTNQLGMGDIFPKEKSKSALLSIYKNNFTPDINTVYGFEKPKHRVLAASGEAVLVNGSWPKEAPMKFENTHDKTDAWTGLEYEPACDMINEGILKEAFVIIKAVDNRYNGIKRNPWNEVEGSDHYSRAMNSWNILRSLSGETYDGPMGKISFDPKLTPNDFKSFFYSANGWGRYSQKITGSKASYSLELKYGELKLNELSLPLVVSFDTYTCQLNGKRMNVNMANSNGKLIIKLPSLQLKSNDKLTIVSNNK